ncbi:Hypothetical predicted protein, partial [Mytilus galloprovincialis]
MTAMHPMCDTSNPQIPNITNATREEEVVLMKEIRLGNLNTGEKREELVELDVLSHWPKSMSLNVVCPYRLEHTIDIQNISVLDVLLKKARVNLVVSVECKMAEKRRKWYGKYGQQS